jgi:hypothetical protein
MSDKVVMLNADNHEPIIGGRAQILDAEGKLVNIANMNTQERALKEKMSETDADYEHISVANIRNELFEGDNVVVGKTDNGFSKLNGPDKY